MRKILIFNVGGLKIDREGTLTILYSFYEMVRHPNYDMDQLERDRDIQERDFPIGWVIQEENNGKLIFVEVNDNEDYLLVDENYGKHVKQLGEDIVQ